jgi:hypothetical protein
MAVLLITAMAYYFAISYMNQYPAEKVGPSTFACDRTIRNAKFQSTLQARSVPLKTEEEPIFTMLDRQNFTLYADFFNTAIDCRSVSMYQIIESSTTPLKNVSCSMLNGTLFTSVDLSEHEVKIRIVLNDNKLIGAVRMGLSGDGVPNDTYRLQDLKFRQVFSSAFNRTLSQTGTIEMALTKVSNFMLSISLCSMYAVVFR